MELNKNGEVWNSANRLVSDFISLLSSKTFATMATWPKDSKNMLISYPDLTLFYTVAVGDLGTRLRTCNSSLQNTVEPLLWDNNNNNNNTKTYSKQYIGRKNKKTEQNFNLLSALIGLSETRPSESFGVRYVFFSRGFRILGKPLNYIYYFYDFSSNGIVQRQI